MDEDYLNKVLSIAKYKYALDEDIIRGLMHHIEFYYERGYTPRRTVEYLAQLIF